MLRQRLSRIDALLLLMTLIWGTNYSIVKAAFREIDPHAFNALRMLLASIMFLTILYGVRRFPRLLRTTAGASSQDSASLATIFYTPAPITRRDWLALAGLGIVGHTLYQYCFISGLARTSVANSSLMLAATPVVIALMTAAFGQDRIGALHWTGVALSMAGIYLVVGKGVAVGHGLTGDLLMVAAVCCWAIYTIAARPLMTRHSPVGVTGLSMAIGTGLYVPAVWPDLRNVQWNSLGAGTWIAVSYSALFALCVAYTIWYAAVRQIGGARTSVYSNLIPLVAMATAVVFLQEPLGWRKIAGAAAVLVGVALTRVRGEDVAIPPEE